MNFNNFKASYGQSDFQMNGYLQNVIDFVLTPNAVLKGNFTMNSNYIMVDEFMSNATTSATTTNTANTITNPQPLTAKGVIMVPANFDLTFSANATKVLFNGLELVDLGGTIKVNKTKLSMNNAHFTVADAKVTMDANYQSESLIKANFDYAIQAKEFDVKKAYNQIKMFRDMASAAKSAQGIVSLDYKIAGKLNADMMPIYPSRR